MITVRIKFKSDPSGFFDSVRERYGMTWSQIAAKSGVSVRTLTNWRMKRTSIPLSVSNLWLADTGLKLPDHEIINLDELRVTASVKGGVARQALYGNAGTREGRARGGRESQKVHRNKLTSPFVARRVTKPEKNPQLAELIGCILGDGSITTYQVVLYSNLADELEYAGYLLNLFKRVFDTEPRRIEERTRSLVKLVCSRKIVVEHLLEYGLGTGSKVKRQADVPLWIKNDNTFAKACLRGLIDTDGCAYIDKHKSKTVTYQSPCIAFTNASVPLLDFVERVLQNNGYTPSRWERSVRLRRLSDVGRYINEIGFGNPKHSRRIKV